MTDDQSGHVIPGAGNLTIEEVVGVARLGWQVIEIGNQNAPEPARAAYQRLLDSRAWVAEGVVAENERRAARGEELLACYGINTGFGAKAGSIGLGKDDIPWVTRNLIVSHSTGVGEALHPEIVRAAMLIRACSLAQGYSGVRPEMVNTLVRMLNRGVIPVIPEYGSVGASGDLAPLSHLAQVLSKRPSSGGSPLPPSPNDYDESGKAYLLLEEGEDPGPGNPVSEIDGKRYALLSGHAAMRRRNIEPLELGAKEGLALNNGTSFSTAIAALALYDAENLARHAEIAAALSLEAMLGFRDAFLPQVHHIRGHRGQIETAERVCKITHGSTLLDGDLEHDPATVPPQDPYSLRVVPQVTGAVLDVLRFVRQMVSTELNAATDNPSIFIDLPRQYKNVSGGNFHGAPIAYVMDFLGIVITDLGSLSERRSFRLLDSRLSQGLPDMLIEDPEDKPGQTSGLMLTQYLAAGIVSDCKTLAHPDSVDSIPTSANQEDHVSMSMNAARHARKIVENINYVVAIELLCASVALEWRSRDLKKRLAQGQFENRNRRSDCRLKEMQKLGLKVQIGTGSAAAIEAIHDCLYSPDSPLPRLGEQISAEDRFTQPYVLRMFHLLRSGEIVRKVYSSTKIS